MKISYVAYSNTYLVYSNIYFLYSNTYLLTKLTTFQAHLRCIQVRNEVKNTVSVQALTFICRDQTTDGARPTDSVQQYKKHEWLS